MTCGHPGRIDLKYLNEGSKQTFGLFKKKNESENESSENEYTASCLGVQVAREQDVFV